MAKALPISDVGAETPIGAFAARVIETRVGEVRALMTEPLEADAELVHDRRVAMRRLRTALEVFEPALPKRARRVRRELKRAFASLGARRDADVAVEVLHGFEPELGPEDRPGFAGLLTELDAEPAPSLDAEAVLRACDDAVLLAARAREGGGPPAADALRGIAARRLHKVQDGMAVLDDPHDADALHRLRITAKRLRYVLEAAEPALGEGAADGAKVARELQTVLGDLHDCDVMLPRAAEHRRALRAADVAAVRAGAAPPNADRYRGIQAVDTRLRARRAALLEEAVASRADLAERLARAAADMGLGS